MNGYLNNILILRQAQNKREYKVQDERIFIHIDCHVSASRFASLIRDKVDAESRNDISSVIPAKAGIHGWVIT
jgi:hypothetical protein